MSDKPSYLGLLNAVSLAETRAYEYLTEWAAVTPDPDVRQVLLTVAAREGEHGLAFAKRINELGFELRTKDDPDAAKRKTLVRSKRSDLDKMKALGLHKLDTGEAPDIFDDFFKDHSIDVQTGALLGRYIAEERDTARLLRSCYECLKAAAGSSDDAGQDNGTAPVTPTMESLDVKVDALCRAVDELRQIVCAQSMPAAS